MVPRRAYDEAREKFLQMSLIQHELKSKVINELQQERESQVQKFRQSSREFWETLKAKQAREVEEINSFVDNAIQAQMQDHAIEWENLEAKLARIPRKRPKYSKTVIEWIKMEARLIQLSQFEDAKVIRSKIDRRIPFEEARFHAEFEKRIDGERRKLMVKQQEDRARLEEKLKTMRWDHLRRRERESKIATQRLDYHHEAMKHSHRIEGRLDPELGAVHPSALLSKRRGYVATSASFRGQQLEAFIRHEKGKLDPREKDMAVVFADSLVERHDFDRPLDGTISLR